MVSGPSSTAAVKFISLATGGSGGTYYVIGADGKIIEKYAPEIKVSRREHGRFDPRLPPGRRRKSVLPGDA